MTIRDREVQMNFLKLNMYIFTNQTGGDRVHKKTWLPMDTKIGDGQLHGKLLVRERQ